MTTAKYLEKAAPVPTREAYLWVKTVRKVSGDDWDYEFVGDQTVFLFASKEEAALFDTYLFTELK
ncbi:hypothetical protein ABIB06_001855 [Bradyrhizobium sp. LB8.2]|uniref:hypothetical protein n=1 Tax=Bradyrhizobium sp. LB8.2 TaxID=3156330 RepID=UPI00339285B8